jgi:hypothetical protein
MSSSGWRELPPRGGTVTDDRTGHEEAGSPQLGPRYFGVVLLSLILAGCVVLVVVGGAALLGGNGTASDFFALVIGVVGVWYVRTELTTALARLRDARAAAAGTSSGPAAP